MLTLLSIVAQSAVALTALSASEDLPGDRLAQAVALRCPEVDVELYAAITPEPDGYAVNLMGDDLVHAWHMDAAGTAEGDRVRQISVAICNRAREHAAAQQSARAGAQLPERAQPGPLELRAFIGTDPAMARPELGARISRCITAWCPEASLALRARPWSNNTARDSLTEPRWALVAGVGRQLGVHYRAGGGLLFESTFERDGSRWGGLTTWMQRDLRAGFHGRISLEVARTGGDQELWLDPDTVAVESRSWTRAHVVLTLLWGRT